MKWTRFVKGGRFREVTEHDGALVVRTGEGQLDAKTERVAQDLASYLKKLKRSGWEEYDVVEKPLPVAPPPAVKTRVKQAWSAALAPLRDAYREALAKAGIRFEATFDAQTRGEQDPNELARRCLALAEASFHTEFSRACFDDEEHGTGGWPIPEEAFARFYASPKRVQEIAEKRIAGKLGEDDGRFPKGRVTGRRPTSGAGVRARAARSPRSS